MVSRPSQFVRSIKKRRAVFAALHPPVLLRFAAEREKNLQMDGRQVVDWRLKRAEKGSSQSRVDLTCFFPALMPTRPSTPWVTHSPLLIPCSSSSSSSISSPPPPQNPQIAYDRLVDVRRRVWLFPLRYTSVVFYFSFYSLFSSTPPLPTDFFLTSSLLSLFFSSLFPQKKPIQLQIPDRREARRLRRARAEGE